MSNYTIKVKNTSGKQGTILADAGFSYTDNLNEVNKGQLKITGTGIIHRNLFETGSEVFIFRNGTLEFHGFINGLSYLDAGGVSADIAGYEIWLTKQNGDYSSSPYSSTASSTIASDVIGESTKFTSGTIESGANIDFKIEETSSLWNALSSLIKVVGQDIGIDYANLEIDILNHRGSSTSVMTLNDGVDIQHLLVRQSYPIANDVRVYGQSEGETRIKSSLSNGQDATSKSTYGTIRKIHRDASVITQAQANALADKLVAKWKDPVKVYEFEVINPNKTLQAGDVITLNSSTKNLSNEEVRIVGIERGVRGDEEFLSLQVTNKEYSTLERDINKMIAELEREANNQQTYDQFQSEYSNQNCLTCVGGNSSFDPTVACIGGIMKVCAGGAAQVILDPGCIFTADQLNIGGSSTFTYIDGSSSVGGCVIILNMCDPTNPQDAATKAYVDSQVGASGLWTCQAAQFFHPCDADASIIPNCNVGGSNLNAVGTSTCPWDLVRGNLLIGVTCASAPVTCGSTCVIGGVTIGSTCVYGPVVCGSTSMTTPVLTAVNCAGIGASPASGVDLNVGGCMVVTYADTTCICGSRKLRVPVGTNCY
jgi:hypothetical protein